MRLYYLSILIAVYMCECVCMPSRCSLSRHQSAERKTWDLAFEFATAKRNGSLRQSRDARRLIAQKTYGAMATTVRTKSKDTLPDIQVLTKVYGVFLEGSAELRYFRILLMATMKKHDTNDRYRERKGEKRRARKRKEMREQRKKEKEKRKGKKKKEMRIHVCATVSHRLVVAAAISRMHWYGSVKHVLEISAWSDP